ncbi:MAG: Glutamate--tRNA ligase 1 [Planctomycetota bacterium]|jgi:glutamyl-tRNA synthetase
MSTAIPTFTTVCAFGYLAAPERQVSAMTTETLPPVTRFAPSPSGHLHVGGARTALFAWAFAKGRGGRFVIRIEDTDQKRSSDAASVGFLKDLEWLGIRWDEGPEFTAPDGSSVGGGANGPYFQSERLAIYNRYLEQLLVEGKAYEAWDTAEELDAMRKAAMARKEAFRYRYRGAVSDAERAAYLAEGRQPVIRFRAPERDITIHDEVLGDATLPLGEVDDFVIRKKDGFPTYHFAVVVDDELMGVTHVLRAQEHFTNTAKHMVLQDALGFRRPVYGHLSIIKNPDDSKMSKRDKDKVLRKAVHDRAVTEPPMGTVSVEEWSQWLGDANIQLELEGAIRLGEALGVQLPEINVDDFRRSGYLPEVLCNFLALNGWSPGGDIEKFDNAFLQERFGLDRVMKTPAKFDRVKLLAFNTDAITGMDPVEFARRCREHAARFRPEFLEALDASAFALLMKATQERSKTLDDPFRANGFLLVADDELGFSDDKNVRKALGIGAARADGARSGLDHLRALRDLLAGAPDWSQAALEQLATAYAAEHAGGKIGAVAQPLRIGVSGSTVSPPIWDTLVLVGKDRALRRIDRCIAWSATLA